MWDDGQSTPDNIKPQPSEISTINFDLATREFDSPEQSLSDRALARTGSTDDTDLLGWLDIESETLEDEREVWSVFHLDIGERDGTHSRPRLVRLGIGG